MTHPGDRPQEKPPSEQTVARWRQAEAGLFASVMMSPESYQAAVAGVRDVVEMLRVRGESWSDLVDADVLAERLRADGWAPNLDPLVVSGAALAVRHREVALAQAARERLRLLQAGRAAGQRWVVLEERGPAEGDPLRPYRRLEADGETGRALLVTAEPDETFTGCVHTVSAAAVDLATGRLREPGPPGEKPSTHPDADDREERVRTLRVHAGQDTQP